MTYPVTFGGQTFTADNFSGFNYSANWERFLGALELAASDIAIAETASSSAASAAQAALATALAITGAGQGIGANPLDVVRPFDLADTAFLPSASVRGWQPAARGAAYQILPQDYGLALIAETGTLTWTLPLLSTLPAGWWISVWNRSGATLTINRSGADVIGASSTSVTAANNTGMCLARRDGTRFERVG